MGAKVGRRVYWPGSVVFCPDPELLDIGDDVVFGSRSQFYTSDAIGSGKIVLDTGCKHNYFFQLLVAQRHIQRWLRIV